MSKKQGFLYIAEYLNGRISIGRIAIDRIPISRISIGRILIGQMSKRPSGPLLVHACLVPARSRHPIRQPARPFMNSAFFFSFFFYLFNHFRPFEKFDHSRFSAIKTFRHFNYSANWSSTNFFFRSIRTQ